MEHYKVGDAVRVIDDIARVHDLQENHGGWIDDMALVRNMNVLSWCYPSFECLAVSGSSGSCVPGLPHWRCPSWR